MKNIKEYFLLILFLIFSFSCSKFEKKDSKNGNNKKIKDKKEISIIGVGDIMLGSNYPNEDLLPNTNILKNVESILQNADITAGNLEGTLFDKGGDPKNVRIHQFVMSLECLQNMASI